MQIYVHGRGRNEALPAGAPNKEEAPIETHALQDLPQTIGHARHRRTAFKHSPDHAVSPQIDNLALVLETTPFIPSPMCARVSSRGRCGVRVLKRTVTRRKSVGSTRIRAQPDAAHPCVAAEHACEADRPSFPFE